MQLLACQTDPTERAGAAAARGTVCADQALVSRSDAGRAATCRCGVRRVWFVHEYSVRVTWFCHTNSTERADAAAAQGTVCADQAHVSRGDAWNAGGADDC